MKDQAPFTPFAFGKFFLLDRIAVGGMAEIYCAAPLAAAVGTPRFCVIKKLLPRYASHKPFVEMMIDEARILSFIDHPNIIKVYDLGSAADGFYLQLEWVRGVSLDRLIGKLKQQGQVVPAAIAAAILHKACTGLAAVHRVSDGSGRPLLLVHRDLTPGNFLLGYNGDLKLCDFGIATAAKERRELPHELTFGKLPYMSPEQVGRQGVSQRSDLYSLGAVFYELLTGQRLFSAKTEMELQDKILKAPATPLPWPRRDLPGSWGQALARLLSRDPQQRPAEVGQVPALFEGVAAADTRQLAAFLVSTFSAEIAAEKKRLEEGCRQLAARSEKETPAVSTPPALTAPQAKTEVMANPPAEQATGFVPLAKMDLARIHRQAEQMKRQAAATLAIEGKNPAATPPLEQGRVTPTAKTAPGEVEAGDLTGFQEVSLPPAPAGEKTELFKRNEDPAAADSTPLPTAGGSAPSIDPQSATWLADPADLSQFKPPEKGKAEPLSDLELGDLPPPPAAPTVTPPRVAVEPTVEYRRPTPPQPAKALPQEPEEIAGTSFWSQGLSSPRFWRKALLAAALILALALSAVALRSLLLQLFNGGVSATPWPADRPARVELRFYRLSGEPGVEFAKFLRTMFSGGDPRRNTLQDIETLFKREHTRHTGQGGAALQLLYQGVEEISQAPPAQDPLWGGPSVIDFFRRLPRVKTGEAGDLTIHVYFYTADPLQASPYPLEYQGRRPRGQGVVFAPAGRDDLNYSLMTMAHEIALLFGARNKYDSANQPIYPQGYVEPFRTPLYPQEKGELMAKAIPLSASQFLGIARLEEVAIGTRTAQELGWISANAADRYYQNAGPR